MKTTLVIFGITGDLAQRKLLPALANVIEADQTGELSIVGVSRRETDVLELLIRRSGRVVPKDVMEEKLYGFDDEVSSNSVEVHVSRLRKRLVESGADVMIKTRRGIGYIISSNGAAVD